MIRTHYRHATLIETRGDMRVAACVLGEAMGKQHACFGIINWPMPIADAARKAVHDCCDS
jgi:hypothetical protein